MMCWILFFLRYTNLPSILFANQHLCKLQVSRGRGSNDNGLDAGTAALALENPVPTPGKRMHNVLKWNDSVLL